MVRLPLRLCLVPFPALLVELATTSDCGLWCSLARASARSSAWTCLFGAPSSFISHPWGGDGGGEIKNSLPASGRLRCSSLGLIGVCWPK
jgi:hypothetical protein